MVRCSSVTKMANLAIDEEVTSPRGKSQFNMSISSCHWKSLSFWRRKKEKKDVYEDEWKWRVKETREALSSFSQPEK